MLKEILKKIVKKTGLTLLIVIAIASIFVIQKCRDRTPPELRENEYLLETEVYRPPIIKLPFVKDKQPVKDKDLPIPKEEVSKSIAIETGIPGSRPIEIVIDKKGNVYKTKDTPEDVKITVTDWKPRPIQFDMSLGYTIALSEGKVYHCVAVDLITLYERLSLGVDAGISPRAGSIGDYLIGIAGRYRVLDLSFSKSDHALSLSITGGYDLLHGKGYIGANASW